MSRLEKLLRTIQGAKETVMLDTAGVSNDDLANIVRAIEANETITTISLRNSNVNNDGLKVLSRLLCLSRITHLDLSDNDINEEGLSLLAEVITKRDSGSSLLVMLDGNPIDASSLEESSDVARLVREGVLLADINISRMLPS